MLRGDYQSASGPSLNLTGLFTLVLVLFVAGNSWSLHPPRKGDASPFTLKDKTVINPELRLKARSASMDKVQHLLTDSHDQGMQRLKKKYGRDVHVRLDERSATPIAMTTSIPLLPGKGKGNAVSHQQVEQKLGEKIPAVNREVVEKIAKEFIDENVDALNIKKEQLGVVQATKVSEHLWNIRVGQQVRGIPVRDARLTATINNGNLIMLGTRNWGNADVDTTPKITAEEALDKGFAHVNGRYPQDVLLVQPLLQIVPVSPLHLEKEGRYNGPLGQGYAHRLVWTFVFKRPPERATWEVTIDAATGELLSFKDTNKYLSQQIAGNIYPLTNTGVCPSYDRCGEMQLSQPMPYADTGLTAPNDFTNSAGLFDYSSGSVQTKLFGKYVQIYDECGEINETAAGGIDLGGANRQHDCTSAGTSPGNTAAARSSFYEVNKIQELARGYLPDNSWLKNTLGVNLNLSDYTYLCNAYWDGSTLNFFRTDGSCRNLGEIAAVLDHEWAHGLDQNTHPVVNGLSNYSNPSESFADIAAIYRLQSSCVGYGFFTSDQGCGQTADGTGFNTNESMTGTHCALSCSGIRDADWKQHQDGTPDTIANYVFPHCGTSPFGDNGPCERESHCESAIDRQAAWDFAARDLQGYKDADAPAEYVPLNYDANTAFIIASKLFYQASGAVGDWHSCSDAANYGENGCEADNAYMAWLAADDDDGDLTNGTPHMTALYHAFNRHGIACNDPALAPAPPRNSGCSDAPIATPVLSVLAENQQTALSWGAVTGAAKYQVFRSEGHAGCDSGKTLIATVTGTTYSDTGLANDRQYCYSVMALGSSDACFTSASPCICGSPASGQSGTIQGTVRNAETNLPVPGADVSVSGRPVFKTGSLGFFEFASLPVGETTVNVSAYGYVPATATVSVQNGIVTAHDVPLTPAPVVTVQGTVNDGAGHGWPLYASLTFSASGFSQTVFSDPATGGYRINLNPNVSYTVVVTVPGYMPLTRGITPGAGGLSESFNLALDQVTCSAPGYSKVPTDLYREDFEAGNGGFTAFASSYQGTTWKWGAPTAGPGVAHSGANAWGANLTGSDWQYQEGYAVSPIIDLSANAGKGTTLSWWQWISGNYFFIKDHNDSGIGVEASADGGATWSVVYRPEGLGPAKWTEVSVVLPATYSTNQFRVRFYWAGTNDGWFFDDVAVHPNVCQTLPGGLVVGNVINSTKGTGQNEAIVSAGTVPPSSVMTIATPNDPALADGFFALYSQSGAIPVTASFPGFITASRTIDVVADSVTKAADFRLDPTPLVQVEGVVTDASGHGWPLYATIRITAPGYENTVFTDPLTGRYSLQLNSGTTYTFVVSAGDYADITRDITTTATGNVENFALTVSYCSAPGYAGAYTEKFDASDGGFTASAGSWKWMPPITGPVTAHSGTHVWAIDPTAGAKGGTLTSSLIDLSGSKGKPLQLAWWQYLTSNSLFDYLAHVEVSKDGGKTWEVVYGDVYGKVDRVWTRHIVSLDASYAVPEFQVRFTMQGAPSANSESGWYVDDISVQEPGTCTTVPGGLVVGNVYMEATGTTRNGALITDGVHDSATSAATVDDPAVDDGFYQLFLSAGEAKLVAFSAGLGAQGSVEVVANAIIGKNFHLGKTGVLQGTVTRQDSGAPIGGAAITVFPGGFSAVTDSAGAYSIAGLPAGTYSVAVSGYGYLTSTTAGISVVSDGATLHSVALASAPLVVVKGYVLDNSGHGWPLYSRLEIAAAGNPATVVYTDPVSGEYLAYVYEDAPYTITVSTPGYVPQKRSVLPKGSITSSDFYPVVDSTCTAPGYSSAGGGCAAAPGGLVVGTVFGETGETVNGATITDGGRATTSAAVTGDAGNPGGFYLLFLDARTKKLFASYQFSGTAETRNVMADRVVRQDFHLASCSYGLSPTSASYPADGGSGTITVSTAEGCAWAVSGVPAWVWISSPVTGRGNGTINYTVPGNPYANTRAATLTIGSSSFSVNQGSFYGTIFGTVTSSAGAIGAASVTATRNEACGTLPASPVAFWSGNGNAADGVGGNSGTARGSGYVSGKIDQAFSFDGSSFVDIGKASSLDFEAGDFSIGFWFKLSSLGSNQTFFRHTSSLNNTMIGYWVEFNPPNGLRFSTVTDYYTRNDLVAPTNLEPGKWYYLTATRSGATSSLYLNGILLRSSSASAPIQIYYGGYAVIGMQSPGQTDSRGVIGSMDEVAVYNRALSEQEIKTIVCSTDSVPPILTDNLGAYSLPGLSGGSYTVRADATGFLPMAAPSVSVARGGGTEQNFVLQASSRVTVNGVVRDNSGHGWPLPAIITISAPGDSKTIYADRLSGAYSIDLYTGTSYTFTVVTPGYVSITRTVVPGDMGTTENFDMVADAATCSAPGYGATFYLQPFDTNGAFSGSGTNSSWAFINLATPIPYAPSAHSGSYAWGTRTGTYFYNYNENGALLSPLIDLSGSAGQSMTLSWWEWTSIERYNDSYSVQVSNDGGNSWTTVYGPVTYTSSDPVWKEKKVVLDPKYSVQNFRVRFTLQTDSLFVAQGVYIDDISIKPNSCRPLSGALVTGRVFNATTGVWQNDARITTGLNTAFSANSLDPDGGAGFYRLFLPGGTSTISADYPGYADYPRTVSVAAESLVQQDFTLVSAGTLQGTVTSQKTGMPVTFAKVTAPGGYSTVTDVNGFYRFNSMVAGTYDLSISKPGYTTQSRQVTVSPSSTTTSDLAIIPTAENVHLFAWGANDRGELGIGSSPTTSFSPVQVPDMTGVLAVAEGRDHTLVLKSDGTVWSWGANYSGMLGDGTTTQRVVPAQIPNFQDIVGVAAGAISSYALRGDGTVWRWGSANTFGTYYAATPTQIQGLDNITAISAGEYHLIALKTDGTVWTWGFDNSDGQLGNGTTTYQSSPTQVQGLENVTAIAAGGAIGLAVKGDGTTWSWGRNSNGQLGDGTTVQRNAPVQIPGLAGVVAVAAGNSHSMALKVDGSVVSWGFNGSGQLGDGTKVQSLVPIPVPVISSVSGISCGRSHSLAVKTDGTAYSWGDYYYGQLGRGYNNLSVTTPLQIPGLAHVKAVVAAYDQSFALVPFRIVQDSIADGSLGAAYSQTLTSTSTIGASTWSITAGALPAGLSLNGTTGVISGTPTTTGTYTFTVQVVVGALTAPQKEFTLVVYPQLSITTTTLQPVVSALPFSQVLNATGGKLPYSWKIDSGLYPSGMAVNQATGEITGTPAVANTYSFVIKVTDANGMTATKPFSLLVYNPLLITTSSLAAGVNADYSQTLAASGGRGTYTWTMQGGLPAGLSFDQAAGRISGRPTTAGTSTVTVTVADQGGDTATASLPITVYEELLITTASLPYGMTETSYNQTVTASGGQQPYTWSILSGSMPVGLTLNPANGEISGTPIGGGTNFVVRVVDKKGLAVTRTFSIPVYGKLKINTTSLSPGMVNVDYQQTVVASGGVGRLTLSTDGALPAGVALNQATGAISGRPTAAGTHNFNVTAADQDGHTATVTLSVIIYDELLIDAASLPFATTGTAYGQSVVAVGGKSPYTWSLASGSTPLPPGISLNPASGALTGSPTTAETYSFTVQVTDNNGFKATRIHSIAVYAPLAITTGTLPVATAGSPYSSTLTGSGGAQAYTWRIVNGELPTGLSLNEATGVISGTPSAPISVVCTVRLTDAVGVFVEKVVTLTTREQLVVTTPDLPTAKVGMPYTQTSTAGGGTPTYRWSVSSGTLPPGLSLNETTGAISGTPTNKGTFTFTVKVTDELGITAVKAFSVTVVIPDVRINGIGTVYYPLIQDAYLAAKEGEAVLLHASDFTENLLVDQGISWLLQGGYDDDYLTASGYSNIHGTLTISNGTVTVSNIVLMP